MANIQYISIIRLFEYCDIPTGDDFDLSRTKKQLLAEFNIAEEGFIEIDEYTYTRHDVFEEIERPYFSTRLIFHKQLWECPQILSLLEKNTADLDILMNEFTPFWGNLLFDEFFSPYFAGPFNHLSRNLLVKKQLATFSQLFVYENFILPPERDEAFRSLRIFLEENDKILRNTNGGNYSIMRPKIIHWIEEEWETFFNMMPDEFYDIKLKIIRQLVNIGVAVQKSYRADVIKMSHHLVLLTGLPSNLSETIYKNHGIYTRTKMPQLIPPIIFILWLIFTITRYAACSSDDSSYNNSSAVPVYFDSAIRNTPIDTLVNILSSSGNTSFHTIKH